MSRLSSLTEHPKMCP